MLQEREEGRAPRVEGVRRGSISNMAHFFLLVVFQPFTFCTAAASPHPPPTQRRSALALGARLPRLRLLHWWRVGFFFSQPYLLLSVQAACRPPESRRQRKKK